LLDNITIIDALYIPEHQVFRIVKKVAFVAPAL